MTVTDGRVRRGERNREAIVDALLACYESGILRPSLAEVAQRAAVSVRSVHNHFDDVETLRAELADRQWERHSHLLEPHGTVEELVAGRAAFYEAVTPVRRAALLTAHYSPIVTRDLARLDRVMRRQLRTVFPEIDDSALDAVELVTSWDAWNRLRTAQGCTVGGASHVVVEIVRTLTQGEIE